MAYFLGHRVHSRPQSHAGSLIKENVRSQNRRRCRMSNTGFLTRYLLLLDLETMPIFRLISGSAPLSNLIAGWGTMTTGSRLEKRCNNKYAFLWICETRATERGVQAVHCTGAHDQKRGPWKHVARYCSASMLFGKPNWGWGGGKLWLVPGTF